MELGNAYASQQDYVNAEHYFQQAIQQAQANKARFSEMSAI